MRCPAETTRAAVVDRSDRTRDYIEADEYRCELDESHQGPHVSRELLWPNTAAASAAKPP